jgi:SAM-dependent methyltransferase
VKAGGSNRAKAADFSRIARCEELRRELCNIVNGGNRTVKALNLGCGARVHPAWVNIDKGGRRPGVRAWDLSRGIPFPGGEFDVVYHSHLLEHFPRAKGQAFLRDCFRVTRPGGVIRVAVPDLERITRLYLESLERALCGDAQGMCNYEWMTLEMYDQTVREKSGGGMIDYLQQDPVPNEEFVIERFGSEARRALSQIRAARARARQDPTLFSRFDFRFRKMWRQRRFFFLWLFLSKERYAALRLGLFRGAGEVHLWMYDRYSLARALEAAGFDDPRQVAAAESRISGWKDFGLDTEPDGSIYKPDSLYMEAVKP